jgi:hypothetical protein
MRSTFAIFVGLTWLILPHSASAYIMVPQSYSNMFERADVVVIATPLSTQKSKTELALEVKQPKSVTDLITTVNTEFQVAYVLKGTLDTKTIHFLHLNLKEKKAPRGMVFGAVGTFFVDFETKENKRQSFILFMKKRKDGTYYPAWRPMEGSRAIIAVKKDGEL